MTTPETVERGLGTLRVGDDILVTLPALSDTLEPRTYSQIFQFYNWEHRDVQISLKMKSGEGSFMYQRTGQLDYSQNIYTGVPQGDKNSVAAEAV